MELAAIDAPREEKTINREQSLVQAEPQTPADAISRGSVWEVARVFFKLGAITFGGPAAGVAVMDQEVVRKRGWLSQEHFMDLMAATNLVPGANVVEMAIHTGYVRAGWPGLVAAGVAFIVPAFLVSLAMGWVYVRYGSLPQGEALLYGIGPAVVALVLVASYRMGRSALRDKGTIAVGLVSLVAALLGANVVLILLAAGVAGVLLYTLPRHLSPALVIAPMLSSERMVALSMQAAGWLDDRLVRLGLFFLKVGTLLFGSGMVLFAFIQDDVVDGYGWLTQQQLVDAIAVGQMTPGPVLSSATFIGYLVAGVPGALVATVAIFLPSFVITALVGPWIPRLRRSPTPQAFLRGVNAAVVALILAVSVPLFRSSIIDVCTALILVGGLVALVRFRVDTLWLIGGGALLGFAHYLLM